ncbi:MAG: hypothetical protein U0441_31130 [Polyangiaceae bacterium]
MIRSSRILCLPVVSLVLAGCGLVTVHSSSPGAAPSQCDAAVPVETSKRADRMKVVAEAERARFVTAAQGFNDSDNDGKFEVAQNEPLLVTRCNRDDITLYTPLGRVVRFPMSQAGERLLEQPTTWNLDEERSPTDNSTESLLANATKEMLEEVAATNLVKQRAHCQEVELAACQIAKQKVEQGPLVADPEAAATSACSSAGEKAFAECFDVKDKRWLATLAALRTVEGKADEAQKDLVRRKLQ